MIRTLIVDDERLARNRIRKLLIDVAELELIGECSSGKEAIEKINNDKPDLIFMDIQMKDMDGFDVLQRINRHNNPIIIFVTAFDEFALKAFNYFAFDYLLKPFKDERFFASISKAIKNFSSNQNKEINERINDLITYIKNPQRQELKQNKWTSKIPIKSRGKVSLLEITDIKYIMASGYYAEIFTHEKEYLLRESLNNLNDKISSYGFIRIHRSTIINLSFLKELVYSNFNEIDVKMIDGKLFRVSKSHKRELLIKLGVYEDI